MLLSKRGFLLLVTILQLLSTFVTTIPYIIIQNPSAGINIREDAATTYYGYTLTATTNSTGTLTWSVLSSSPAISGSTWDFYSNTGLSVLFGYKVTSGHPFTYITAATYIVTIQTTDSLTSTVTTYLRVNIIPVNQAPVLSSTSNSVSIPQKSGTSTCLLANTLLSSGAGCSATFTAYDIQNTPITYAISGVDPAGGLTFFSADSAGRVLTTAEFSLSAAVQTYTAYINVVNGVVPRLTSTFTLSVGVTAAPAKLTINNLPNSIPMYDTITANALVYSFQTSTGSTGATGFSYWFTSNPLPGAGKFRIDNTTGNLYTASGATFDSSSNPAFYLVVYVAELGVAAPQTTSGLLTITLLKGTTSTTTTTTTTRTTTTRGPWTIPPYWPRSEGNSYYYWASTSVLMLAFPTFVTMMLFNRLLRW